MIYCIHGSHVGKQCLSSTNVGSSFFAAYMLFSCLQSHTQATVALGIYTYANNSSGNISFELIFSGKKCSMRTAKTHWYSKPLGGAYCNICTQFSGRR